MCDTSGSDMAWNDGDTGGDEGGARRGEESRYGAMRGERRRYEAAEYNFKVGQSSTEGLGGKELGLAKIQAEYLGKEMTWEKREASGVDPALGKAKWSGIRMGRTSVKPEEMVVKSPDAFDHRMMHDAGWPDSPRLTVSVRRQRGHARVNVTNIKDAQWPENLISTEILNRKR
ncbi:hypothetical protein C8F01DRAFT_1089558 [Mycena amicta]|nr:hypothetical protein C8F01DRAFT_1089558 [Mycena amicta]